MILFIFRSFTTKSLTTEITIRAATIVNCPILSVHFAFIKEGGGGYREETNSKTGRTASTGPPPTATRGLFRPGIKPGSVPSVPRRQTTNKLNLFLTYQSKLKDVQTQANFKILKELYITFVKSIQFYIYHFPKSTSRTLTLVAALTIRHFFINFYEEYIVAESSKCIGSVK